MEKRTSPASQKKNTLYKNPIGKKRLFFGNPWSNQRSRSKKGRRRKIERSINRGVSASREKNDCKIAECSANFCGGGALSGWEGGPVSGRDVWLIGLGDISAEK